MDSKGDDDGWAVTAPQSDPEFVKAMGDLSIEVSRILISQGLVHTSLVLKEVDWFFNRLGIDGTYFKTTSPAELATHITSIYAGKILAKSGNGEYSFDIRQEEVDRAFFVCKSEPLKRFSAAFALEQKIEESYLMQGYSGIKSSKAGIPFRLKVFRSSGHISSDLQVKLRFYVLQRPEFRSDVLPDDLEIAKIADAQFIKNSSEHTQKLYQNLIKQANYQIGPVVFVTRENCSPQEARLCVAYKHGSTHSAFSTVSDIYHVHKLLATKKFVEQFANGFSIISVYLRPMETASGETVENDVFEKRIAAVHEDVRLFQVLPRTSLSFLFQDNLLNAHEVCYSYCAWKFAHQFLSRYNREYSALLQSLQANDPASVPYLLKLKGNLRKDTFTEEKVAESMQEYKDILRLLYADFESRFLPSRHKIPYSGLEIKRDQQTDFDKLIATKAKSEFDILVLQALLKFNQHILKTNFFMPVKSAFSFRLDPRFLSSDEYESYPFGIFFVIGSEFRGFHVRFQDVARGGIRIIRSNSAQAFAQNVGSVFDENYNLASTQQRKNKDIPEGGSKGTIFLSLNHQDKGLVAFKKYIDSLCDVLLPNADVVDLYGQQEILFLGPDEGTAEYMDWASQHARHRGASFWKAFTTGKSMSLGGIPHDIFGMTTRGVHQYVLGVLEKMGWEESKITKFQTGGPDGDLGSNEVLCSKDKTIGIVDGSGVLFDPNGLNREELTRLAMSRKMVRCFDKKYLSPQGFFVDIEDREVKLPDGEIIDNGLLFRNNFHLDKRSAADIFVPCGGRPEAVHVNNVQMLFDNGVPRFKAIVEGANLFFTQGARKELESRGVILYKDSSANKGGVTSSSLEVLAALALNDEEFSRLMAVQDSKNPPAFYSAYVAEVHRIIEKNARMEFECIWREHLATKKMRCEISDLLSHKINSLNAALVSSSLWKNQKLRERVIRAHCPKILIDTIGIDKLFERVPDSYLKAIFGSNLAGTFIYEFGLSTPEFAFFDFMEKYLA